MTADPTAAATTNPGLRRRLTLFIAGAVVLAIVLLALATGATVRTFLHVYATERLAHDRDTLTAAITVDEDGRLRLPAQRLGLVYGRPLSGHYYQISTPDGILRSRSLWDDGLEAVRLAPGERRVITVDGPGAQRLLTLSSGVEKEGVAFTVTVAEDISDLQAALLWLYGGTAIGGVMAAAVLILLLGILLRRMLRPLDRLRLEVNRLETGEIQSLGVEGVPREVLPLVQEVNRLLELLFRRLTRSRRALGDLAHALKTPLAAIGRMPGEPALRTDPELAARLRRHVGRMQRTLDSEMRRARLAGGAYAGGRVGLADVIGDLLNTLGRIHRDRGIDARTEIPADARIRMDREDLMELLGVLLDNAFKWASSRVEVSYSEDASTLALKVEDDGPGVAPEAMGGLTERGYRLDESREGSGLGLAIAGEIAAEYGGGLRFEGAGRLGGLSVTLRLPKGGTHRRTGSAHGYQSSSSSP